jgi:hypothetical protein
LDNVSRQRRAVPLQPRQPGDLGDGQLVAVAVEGLDDGQPLREPGDAVSVALVALRSLPDGRHRVSQACALCAH